MSRFGLSRGQDELYQAVSRHQLEDIDRLLQGPIDVNFVHPDSGLSPLHVVASLNFMDVLLKLLAHIGTDLDVNIIDRKLETPLLKVVNSHGDRAMILMLVQLGASIWQKNISGVSPASVLFHQRHDDEFWLIIVGYDVECNVLVGVRSPILYVNKLFKEKTVGNSTRMSVFAKFVHKLLIRQEASVLRVLILWYIAFARAATCHPNESSDLMVFANKLRHMIDEIFNCDCMDKPVNVQRMLNPDTHISRRESLLKYQMLSLRKGGVLDLCLQHKCMCLFSKQQVSGFIDRIFWLPSTLELSPQFERNLDKESYREIQPAVPHQTSLQTVDLVFRMLRVIPLNDELLRLSYSVRSCPGLRFYSEAVSRAIVVMHVGYIGAFLYPDHCPTDFSSSSCDLSLSRPEMSLLLLVTSMLVYETGEILEGGWKGYISDGWNLFDLSGIACLVLWGVLRGDNLSFARIFLALAAIPLSLGMLRFLAVVPSLGLTVSTAGAMLNVLPPFFLVYLLSAGGFGIFFTSLFPSSSVFSCAGSTVLTVFSYALSDFDFSVFDSSSKWVNSLGQGVLIVYLLFVAVLLINLLIAKMSSAYEVIDQLAGEVWAFAKCKTVTRHLLLKERHVFCMLLPPFNLLTAMTLPWHYDSIRTKGISLGGTVTNFVLNQLAGPIRAFLFVGLVSPSVNEVMASFFFDPFPGGIIYRLWYGITNLVALLSFLLVMCTVAVFPLAFDTYYAPLPKASFHVSRVRSDGLMEYLHLAQARGRLIDRLLGEKGGKTVGEQQISKKEDELPKPSSLFRPSGLDGVELTQRSGDSAGLGRSPLHDQALEVENNSSSEVELESSRASGYRAAPDDELVSFPGAIGDADRMNRASVQRMSLSYEMHGEMRRMGSQSDAQYFGDVVDDFFSPTDIQRIMAPLLSAACISGEMEGEGGLVKELREELEQLRGEVKGLRDGVCGELVSMRESMERLLAIVQDKNE